MTDYRLSWHATKDLREIAEFSVRHFGAAQARSYGRGLISALEMLTRHPLLGSDQGHVRARIRRYVYGSHAVYYRLNDDGIVILRILGSGQDPLRHI